MITRRVNEVYVRANTVCLLVCVLGMVTGCTPNRYQAPVGSFYNATQQTTGVIADYYSSRNAAEIDLYLSELATDPSSPQVLTTDSKGHPTPLGAPVFSPAAIQARLDALTLVATYAHRLNDLANSTAPSDFQNATNTLGKNLSSLGTTFQNLSGSDPLAGKYITPITTLVGIIGQLYLKDKRDQLIKRAVNDGAPKVDEILSYVRDDLEEFSKLASTGANEKLHSLINAYDTDLTKPGGLTYDQKVARLAEIKTAALARDASVTSAPSGLVSNMMHAHEALVKTANASPKEKSLTLASLNSALQQWTAQIQTLANQIKLLIK